MKKLLVLLLSLSFVLQAGAQTHTLSGNNIVPGTATLTLQSGSVTDFNAGATVDFTGATVTGLSAIGDVSSNTATSVDGEVALFNLTTGKSIKRATGSGLATLTSGVLGTTANNTTNWDTAFTDRLKWDGGATGLTAATGRTSLGGTTIGQNLFTLTNPSAITFPRFNADNTVSALTAAAFKTALSLTSTDVGLGNVTNDAQTKAAIVPNTAPSAGQILVGNAGGTAYAPVTLSGSGATASLSSAGVLTLSAIPNATLSNSSITIAGTATSLGGSISRDTITGLSTTGIVTRTGANAMSTITDNSANWDTAFTDRLKWDGGATGLNAATGRTSLGASTTGSNLFTLTTPPATSWLKVSNTGVVTTEDAATTRTSLGLAIGTNVEAWDTQLDSLAGLSYTANALKVVRVNAGETGFELATVSGGGATIAATTNLIKGDGAGNGLDSTIAPSNVALLNAANTFTNTGTHTFSGTISNNGLTIGIGPLSSGAWIDMPTTGPSGIGNGGAGANTWIGYASAAGNYFSNTGIGDLIYRNASTKKIHIGIDNGSGTGTSSMIFSGTDILLNKLTSNGFVKTSGGTGLLSIDTNTYLTGNQTITLSGDLSGSGTTSIAATITNSAVTYAKMQNVSATSRILGRKTAGAGVTEELTASDALDFLSATQGTVLYRGATGWAALAPGTAGNQLTTHSTGADPTWDPPGGGSGAPVDATYITQTADATLTNEQALGALATGLLKNTTTTGVLSIATAGTDYLDTSAISDTAFASSWNAVTTVAPSKNAVYDWGHTFDTDDDGKVNVLDVAAGVVVTDLSGVVSVITQPSGNLVGDSATQTLTNKRVNPRVDSSTAANATTWAPNSDTTDVFELAGALTVAVTTISNPTGTPVEGQKLMFRIKSDTSAHALTWSGTQWRASGASGAPALPTTTTASKNLYIGFVYNSTDTKWDLLAVQDGY